MIIVGYFTTNAPSNNRPKVTKCSHYYHESVILVGESSGDILKMSSDNQNLILQNRRRSAMKIALTGLL